MDVIKDLAIDREREREIEQVKANGEAARGRDGGRGIEERQL